MMFNTRCLERWAFCCFTCRVYCSDFILGSWIHGWLCVVLQRLKGLDDGWHTVQKLWEEKQHLLAQSLDYQVRVLP
jgi:hypothetical protein